MRVALREESVDRNFYSLFCSFQVVLVALREESVDRNLKYAAVVNARPGRSPRGERG